MQQSLIRMLTRSGLCLFIALLLLAPCTPALPNARPATAPAVEFSVSGGRILKNGSEFVVHGVSVAGPGLNHKRKTVLDADLIANVWRFNLVRVGCLIKPAAATDVNDLDEIVRTFTARGIVVLIDPRDHIAGYYRDPPNPAGSPSLTDLVGWYKAIAGRYKSNPYVWFEAMSSPGRREERKEPEPWREAHARVLEAIRGDAGARNIIVCEGRFRGDDASPNGALPVVESSSAILTYGPELSSKYANLVFGFHADETWNGGAARLTDFLDRTRSRGLAAFVSEYANSGWADSTHAIEAVLSVCRDRHIGRCVWAWFPSDYQRLCAPDEKQGGWQIDTVNGSKPTNLSWVGDRVWDDNHNLIALHGPALDRTAWTATSFTDNMVQPGRTFQPDNVFSPYIYQEDYWVSNRPQEPGQWFQVDMGAKQTFSRMMIDTRYRFGDYPRGYEVFVSGDGAAWGQPIAKGAGTQSTLRLAFPAQTARFIKIVTTAKTWHPWVIANIEVYAPIGTRTAAKEPAGETALEPRAWTAGAGPNRWYDIDVPLHPRPEENRYTATNQPQRPGHYYQVDMGEPQRFNRIVINTGRSLSDFPRGYEVQTSSDGETWSKPIASGRGEPVTTIQFPVQTARFVRVTLTRKTRNYWTIAEFTIYQPASAVRQ